MPEMNRREFIQKGSILTLGAGIMISPAAIMRKNGPLGNIFVHHVFFWLKEPGNSDHQKRFADALKELVTIDAIQSYHIGIPADTRRDVIDSSYQFSLLTIFENQAAHDIYQVHPTHDLFRKVADELCSKVTVYDSVKGS
ncbi:MAG: Dabb family protein [Bacteroidales bacterium]|nr:Dabb family protein [Bacteroidales bacterium]